MRTERTQPASQSNLDERKIISFYLSSIAVSFRAEANDAMSVPFRQLKVESYKVIKFEE
ncbi:MAG TPA: hypothetical protein P5096_01495 [Patescibacteria group bacterium]|nr:hypothetical protein [Patescibacteria group bacterium]